MMKPLSNALSLLASVHEQANEPHNLGCRHAIAILEPGNKFACDLFVASCHCMQDSRRKRLMCEVTVA